MGVKPPPKKGVVTVTYTIFSFDAINHKRDSPGFVYRQNIILYQLLALGGQTTPLISVVGSRDPLFNCPSCNFGFVEARHCKFYVLIDT